MKITSKLIKEYWENKACDAEFREWLSSNKITPLHDEFEKIKIGGGIESFE